MPPGPVVVGSGATVPDAVRRSILFDVEDDAAADPVCLDEPDRYLVPDPKHPTRPPADQPLSTPVALVVVARQGRYRYKPVSSILRRGDEQAEFGDAADVAPKDAADRSGEERCTISPDCRALGRRCTTLGRRDMFRDGR